MNGQKSRTHEYQHTNFLDSDPTYRKFLKNLSYYYRYPTKNFCFPMVVSNKNEQEIKPSKFEKLYLYIHQNKQRTFQQNIQTKVSHCLTHIYIHTYTFKKSITKRQRKKRTKTRTKKSSKTVCNADRATKPHREQNNE